MSELQPTLIDAPVCGVLLCEGASLVQAGAQARTDGRRNQLCELCGERLSRVKHTTKYGVGKKCHPRCKPSKRAIGDGHEKSRTSAAPPSRLQSSAALPFPPPSAPQRSHKRKAASDPGEFVTLPPLQLHPQPFFSRGSSLHSSHRSSRATAASWLDLATNDELKNWEEKRGGFYQHDTATTLVCSFLDEKRVRLRHSAERIARAALSTLGVEAISLKLAAMKLLRSSQGEGKQEIHYDITEYARAIRCFTVLMYLTDTLSTAIPTLPMDEMRHCFTEGEKRPTKAALRFLSHDKFSSVRVSAGDLLALNCAVPQYGVANPDKQDRYVLFLLFSPSSSPLPDTEEQRYPHGAKA